MNDILKKSRCKQADLLQDYAISHIATNCSFSEIQMFSRINFLLDFLMLKIIRICIRAFYLDVQFHFIAGTSIDSHELITNVFVLFMPWEVNRDLHAQHIPQGAVCTKKRREHAKSWFYIPMRCLVYYFIFLLNCLLFIYEKLMHKKIHFVQNWNDQMCLVVHDVVTVCWAFVLVSNPL